MATNYPGTIDSFPVSAGTSLLSSPDHSDRHNTVGSAIIAIENVLGTTAGTSIAKNFASGDFAPRINSSGVLQQRISGTIDTAVLGTPAISGGTITNGTINASVLGTPTIGTIAIPGTATALGFSASIAPGVGSVADAAAGTLTVNAQAGQIYYSVQGTAAGNRTVGTPQNPTGYQQLTYAFKTSGSANSTIVWSSAFRFSQDVGTPALGTGVTWNYFGWRYNQIDSKWDFLGATKNLI